MKYDYTSRRMFLQGLGGYVLAIPFLPSLAPRAHADVLKPPMRFAMVLGHYGRDMSQWYPNIADSSLDVVPGAMVKQLSQLPKPLSYCLGAPFNSVLPKMSLIRGLDTMSTQGNHNAALPTTGSSLAPDSAAGFGYSIDAVLEESAKFYPTLPFQGALRTCPDIKQPFHEFASYSWSSKTVRGQLLNPQWNPSQVYNKLLNPAAAQMINAKNGRLRSVTDMVMENFKQTMNGRSIASEDKLRLDNYLALLADTDRQMSVAAVACNQAGDPGNPEVLNQIHKAMMKLEVAALACGTTKIVMHSIAHSSDAGDPLWHQNAHGGEYTVNPATGRSYLSEYSKYNMDLVAFFLSELDKVQEANGTLLDNTLFLYGNEDGTGSHEHLDLPVIVAGGQGRLKTGYFIDYRPRPFTTLIQRERAVVHAGRPYNSMLVTAFKTLGLAETDYQKFGMTGFGCYDKPFVTAGKHYNQFLGAKINDPLPFLFNG